MVALGPEASQLRGRCHFGDAVLGGCTVQPGKEAGDGSAIPPMCLPGALDLDRVLARLRQLARVGALHDVSFRATQPVEDPGRRAAGIGQHPRPAQAPERLGQLRVPVQGHRLVELRLRFFRKLALIQEPVDPPGSAALI